MLSSAVEVRFCVKLRAVPTTASPGLVKTSINPIQYRRSGSGLNRDYPTSQKGDVSSRSSKLCSARFLASSNDTVWLLVRSGVTYPRASVSIACRTSLRSRRWGCASRL